jgi:hypothetical protein
MRASVTGPAAFSVMHNYLGVSYGGGFTVLGFVTVAGIACVLVSRLHWLRVTAAG